MIVFAVNIHTGGGKVLLDEVLSGRPFGTITAAFLDHRYSPPPASANLLSFKFKNSIFSRLFAEYKLHKFLKNSPQEQVLFFGNLPPLFKTKNPSVLYLQNCYLTGQVPLPKDSFKLFLRCWVERLILKHFNKNIDQVWVQTKWMKTVSKNIFSAPIHVKPFLPQMPITKTQNKDIDLIFVGSTALHKRLSFFLKSLSEIDSKLKNKISVKVVLDNPAVPNQNHLNFQNIDIEFLYKINREQIFSLYSRTKNFVTASLYESYYLPLYEAHFFGCDLIAPIAGYTKDLDFSVSLFERKSTESLAKILMLHLS